VAAVPKPENPLCFDLPKLFKREGRAALEIKWQLENLSTSYSEAQHLDGQLSAESSGEKIVVSGSLLLTWSGPCRRCLETTSGVSELTISEIYESDFSDGETFEIPLDQTLDLKPMLQEQILLALPLTPLCADDCKGPIPEEYPAGITSEQDGEDDTDAPIDPRWKILGTINFDEKETN
tara:strand:- start:120 stop:656 length:537 start_codon:yes stop_codon:yes gene_type:complete